MNELINYIASRSTMTIEEVQKKTDDIDSKYIDNIKTIFDRYGEEAFNVLSAIGTKDIKEIDILDLYNEFGMLGPETILYLQGMEGTNDK